MTTKRGHGEDSIYQDDDRWRGAVSLGLRPDGTRRRAKVSGRTRSEVQTKLRALRKSVDNGLPVPDSRLTVGAFLDRWLKNSLPGTISASTLDNYEDTVRLHLRPALGSRVLTKLTVAEVDALWQAKREDDYAANSIRIMRAVLRKAIGQAEREGLVLRNVVALSAAPRLDADEGRTLTVAQAKSFLTAVKGHRLEACFLLTLTYGLRRGEALGLRWCDLDADAGTLAVRRGVKRIKSRDGSTKTTILVGDLKTRKSRRTLYLTPQLLDAIKRHRAVQAGERLLAGGRWQDEDLMFPSKVGTPHDPDNLSHTFSKICADAGLGHWHVHELRHSGASLMIAQGTPLEVVSEILGHSSITMTKDTYGHLFEDGKRAAAEAMGRLLGS